MIFKKHRFQFHFITILALFVYLSMVFTFTIHQVMQKGKVWRMNLDSTLNLEIPSDHDLNESLNLLNNINNIKVIDFLTEKEKSNILSDWFEDVNLVDISVPNIVKIKILNDQDSSEIKREIKSKIQDVKIYATIDWAKDIVSITQAVLYMSWFLLGLICLIFFVLINFMVKTLIHTYAKEINILHLNGAEDLLISTMLQKNIFIQSLKASFIGVILANLTWLLLYLSFDIKYQFTYQVVLNGCLVAFVVSILASVLAKFNVMKEFRVG